MSRVIMQASDSCEVSWGGGGRSGTVVVMH